MSNETHERDLVRTYVAAKEKADALSAEAKAAKAALEKAAIALIEHMEANELNATASYEGYGRVQSNKPRLFASVTQPNLGKVMEHLRSVGRDDLIKTNINSSSLSAFVSECLEQGNEVPEGVSYYLKPQLRIYP
jgi:hypothetical protein